MIYHETDITSKVGDFIEVYNSDLTTFHLKIFNEYEYMFMVTDLSINDLYFVMKYRDSTVVVEIYDISVYRNYNDRDIKIKASCNKILSMEITNVNFDKVRKSVIPFRRDYISNIRFFPQIPPDYILYNFEDLKKDRILYYF